MYWVKCKQWNSHSCLTILCSHFLCFMVIRSWLHLPIGGHGHMICMGTQGGVCSCENTSDSRTEFHKSSLIPYKQVSVINGDNVWLRMTSVFILWDLLCKVQQSHAANREGSFYMNSRLLLFIASNYHSVIQDLRNKTDIIHPLQSPILHNYVCTHDLV